MASIFVTNKSLVTYKIVVTIISVVMMIVTIVY